MAIGPGKYDDELTRALRKSRATTGILIVIDGERGPGFSCQTTPEYLMRLPGILRFMATQIENDFNAATQPTKGANDASN